MGTNLISVPLMAKMTDGGIEAAGSKNLISRDLCHRDRHLGHSWDVASFPASKVSVPLSHARSQIRVCLHVLPFCPRSFREDIPASSPQPTGRWCGNHPGHPSPLQRVGCCEPGVLQPLESAGVTATSPLLSEIQLCRECI